MGKIVKFENRALPSRSPSGIPYTEESDLGIGWPIRWYMEMNGWSAGRDYFTYTPIPDRDPRKGHLRKLVIKESVLHDLFRKNVPAERTRMVEGVSRVLYRPEDFKMVYELIPEYCESQDLR